MLDPIAITGVSVWSPYGRGVESLMHAIVNARADLHEVEGTGLDLRDPWYYARLARQIPPPPRLRVSGSEVEREVSIDEWPCVMPVESAWDAVHDAGHPQHNYSPERIAVCNGTSHGSNHGLIEHLRQSLERPPDPELIADSAAIVARQIAIRVGARGPNYTINTACSSGINAIGQAMTLLRAGRADCVIAGSHDTFSALSLVGFSSLKALDAGPCRPFDVDRDGLTLADGAAYVVLERAADARARGRTPWAFLTGYGNVSEAYHTTAPDPEGAGALRGMTRALHQDPAPRDLRFVAAHGTGTPANDEPELRAIEALVRAFELEHSVDVVSFKSQLGHGLGAAGSMQVVATVTCMKQAIIPGNIGLVRPIDHSLAIRLPTTPRSGVVPLAICSSLGFGGSMAAVCIRSTL